MSTNYQPPVDLADDAAYAAWLLTIMRVPREHWEIGRAAYAMAMAPYAAAANRWWLSKYPQVRAYYQLRENVQLYPFGEYASDMAILLGRMVFAHEFIAPTLRERLLADSQAEYDAWMSRGPDAPPADPEAQEQRRRLLRAAEAVQEFYKAAAGTGLRVEIVDTGDLGRMGYRQVQQPPTGQEQQESGKGERDE